MWREIWTGADATAHGWLTYAGTTVSVFGDVWCPGVKLRAVAGYGQYRYAGARDATGATVPFHGQIAFADILLGWLWRFGPLTAKTFAGASLIEHAIAPLDPLASNGLKIGPKGSLELWLDVSSTIWTSLDVAYTTAHDTYSVHTRAGYRLWPRASIGLEGVLNGSAGHDRHDRETGMLDPSHRDIRFGGFLRYEWDGGEVSASGGLSTDLLNRQDAYMTLNVIKQF